MESEEIEQEANNDTGKNTSRQSFVALTSETSNEVQPGTASQDDETAGSNAVKPAYALFWAMKKLDSGCGATKKDIVRVLSSKYDDVQDVNFPRKVDVALQGGLEFGLLKQRGDRYYLRGDCGKQMITELNDDTQGRQKPKKPKVIRYYKVKSAEDVRKTESESPRSRSPVSVASFSSESSSEETEGVRVIEWALTKLNDKRGSTLRSIKRMVSSRYRKFRNFDRLMNEAVEDAIASNKVVKNGIRYRLISE